MDNNNDTNEELKIKNQEMLLNKKKIDLDTSMDSLIVFYSNYSTNLAQEMTNRICLLKGIDQNSEQSEVILNTIIGFFTLMSNKFKELIAQKTTKLKEKLATISDEEYSKDLRYMSIQINNQMLEYYGENIDMLVKELVNDVDEVTKDRINNYLFEVIYGKIMNMLRDKFMYSIRVIFNINEENNQVIQDINAKTIK